MVPEYFNNILETNSHIYGICISENFDSNEALVCVIYISGWVFTGGNKLAIFKSYNDRPSKRFCLNFTGSGNILKSGFCGCHRTLLKYIT